MYIYIYILKGTHTHTHGSTIHKENWAWVEWSGSRRWWCVGSFGTRCCCCCCSWYDVRTTLMLFFLYSPWLPRERMKKVSFIFWCRFGCRMCCRSIYLRVGGRSVGRSVGKKRERERLPCGSYQEAQVAMDGHHKERVAAERNWRLCAWYASVTVLHGGRMFT